jgi:hypothetical protein
VVTPVLDPRHAAKQDYPPPYWGAVIYPTMLDTREEMFDMSDLSYS